MGAPLKDFSILRWKSFDVAMGHVETRYEDGIQETVVRHSTASTPSDITPPTVPYGKQIP